MTNTIVTSVALLAASAAAQIGTANVVNNCNFPVTLTNVPSSGGGQNQVGPNTLQTGGTYSQQYTQLTNGNGWSIKLAPASGSSGLLQYEYTFQNDGTIWWDLSAVNGDPFTGNWALSASGGCTVKQSAYLFPTDDANGMQQGCPQSSDTTVTLCGGSGAAPAPAPSGGAPAPSSPSQAAASPPAPVPSVASPAPIASPAPSDPAPSGASNPFGPSGGQNAAASPTTFATFGKIADIVTNVQTKVVTHYVTVSPVPMNKRQEEHLHRHALHHGHF